MSRLEKFHSFAGHAWHKKHYAKLTRKELEFCHEFIKSHDHMDKGEFEKAVNRIGLDDRDFKDQHRHWLLAVELLASANC